MITYGMFRLFFSITLFCLVYASVAEYRSIHEDQLHLKYRQKRAERTDVDVPCPKIKSQSIKIDVYEGENVQFPCEVTDSPQPYVWRNMESGLPELKWTLESWFPILEFRLQIRRQQANIQGPTNRWYYVRSNPRVVVNSVDSDSKYKYTISYVFGEKQEQYSRGITYVPLSLQSNTIYEARIQGRDEYNNWSEWSPNAKFSVDEFTLLWKNGSETILMNGGDSATKNTRVTQSKSPLSNTLSITNVTRWDSGTYTCKLTSECFVEVTHTLEVLYPPEKLSLEVVGARESTTAGGKVKKFIVKQGEPIKFICNVDGNPEPNVQWIKKEKDQQMLLDAQSLGPVSPRQLSAFTVSNTKEFQIRSANAQHDAGRYECIAQNKQSVDLPTNMELELVIEYPPTITVSQPVVQTAESFTALIKCTVNAYPEANVTWEKEQTNAKGSSSFVKLSTNDNSSRYQTHSFKNIVNKGSVPRISDYGLNVTLQSSDDFGNYRCKAENHLGHAYSGEIILTGVDFNGSNEMNRNVALDDTDISYYRILYALFVIIFIFILGIIVAVLYCIRLTKKIKKLEEKIVSYSTR